MSGYCVSERGREREIESERVRLDVQNFRSAVYLSVSVYFVQAMQVPVLTICCKLAVWRPVTPASLPVAVDVDGVVAETTTTTTATVVVVMAATLKMSKQLPGQQRIRKHHICCNNNNNIRSRLVRHFISVLSLGQIDSERVCDFVRMRKIQSKGFLLHLQSFIFHLSLSLSRQQTS